MLLTNSNNNDLWLVANVSLVNLWLFAVFGNLPLLFGFHLDELRQ